MSLSNINRIENYGSDMSNIRTKNYPVPFFEKLSKAIIKANDGDTVDIEDLLSKNEFASVKNEIVGNLIDLMSEGILSFFAKTEMYTVVKVVGTNKKIAYPNLDIDKDKKEKKVKKEKKKQEVKEVFSLSEKDIEERAIKVLDSAKRNNKEGVIDIFEMISLPFNGENYKRAVFEKIFELANIKGEYVTDLGYIVYSKKRTIKTVVSHMDLIPLFNRDFKKGKVYEIKDEKLIGALDNTFTNAVVINSILNLKDTGSIDDTTFLFTKDEETNQYAIKDYMKMYGNEQFVINLDVTNEGMKCNMSVEYDNPSWHICKDISDNLNNPYFTKDRECDDLDNVLSAKGFGFSYCLPTEKTIHSYKNYTLLEKIEPYMEGLNYIIESLCTKNKECNIKYLSIKKAIKHKTFEKMKNKDKYKTRKTTSWKGSENIGTENPWDEESYNKGWADTDDETGGQTYFDFGDGLQAETDPETCTRLSSLIMDIQVIHNPENYYDFEEFIGDKLFSNKSFTKGVFYLISSADSFNSMRKMNLLLPAGDDEFYFNQELVDNPRFQIWEELKRKEFDALSVYDMITANDIFSYDDIKQAEPELDAVRTATMIKSLLTRGLIENKNGKFKILD